MLIIIVIGNNPSLIDSSTRKFHSEFSTQNLGSLSYFLGLEASPTLDGLFISQLKYVRDIILILSCSITNQSTPHGCFSTSDC